MTLGLSLESPSPRDTCLPLILMQVIHSVWGQASPVMQGVCVCVCVCVWLNINLSLKPYICVQLNPGALHTQTSIQGFTATREPGSPDSGFQVA